MERGSKFVNTSEGNEDSPCSALLERLKNLRNWQEEQRKEILGRSAGTFVTESPEGGEYHQDSTKNDKETLNSCDSVGAGKSQHYDQVRKSSEGELANSPSLLIHSIESQQTHIQGLRNENSNFINRKLYNDNHPSHKVLSCYEIIEDVPRSNVSSSHSASLKGHKSDVVSGNDQGTVVLTQENLIYENDDYEQNISKGPLNEGGGHFLNWNPSKEDNYDKKNQGLSHFITRHAVNSSVVHDTVQHIEFNARMSNENSDSQLQPKFKYLKKGHGTSRFGMKPMRLKRNKNSIKDPVKETDTVMSNERPLLKTGRMPIKALQLQDHKRKFEYKECFEKESVQELAARNDPISVSHSYSQQKKVESVLESDTLSRKELEELSAFERLEELADDSSFSSNSSTVIRLLQRGLQSSSSTPIKPPIPYLSPKIQLLNRNSAVEHCTLENVFANLSNQIELSNICSNQSNSQQNQFPPLNVSVVLEQLKKLVRLEDLPLSGLSKEELKSVLESFIENENSFNEGSIFCLQNDIKLPSSIPTSTPAVNEETVRPKPRVHFQPEGVQVLEYELTESEGENTLNDTASIVDDTDLVTTSDLEILTHINVNATNSAEATNIQSCNELYKEQKDGLIDENVNETPNHVVSSGALQPVRLQFSPPNRPKNSASHYIWSIFGKEVNGKKVQQSETLQQIDHANGGSNSPKTLQNAQKDPKASGDKIIDKIKRKESSLSGSKTVGHEEVETHKALLMAKVCELEKEIDFYKKGNEKIRKLQESLQNERSQLENQRKTFHEEMNKEKALFQEYLDAERNKLWKERQSLKPQSSLITSEREQSLEVVFLKEQLKDLQEEMKKKEYLHSVAVKKLDEKITLQEKDLKSLKLKNSSLQNNVKESIQQKQKVDRGNLNKKSLINTKQTFIPAGKSKMKTRTATISSINKSLDKIPVTINDSLKCKQTLQGGIASQTKALGADIQALSNPVQPDNHTVLNLIHQDCNKRETDSVKSIPQEDPAKLSGKRLSISNNLNAQQGHRLVDIENVTDQNDICGLYSENQSFSERNNILKSSVQTNVPGLFSSKVSSPQTQQSINIESTELYLGDGTKEIIYANGNKKSIHPDGTVIISYYNGDQKQVYHDRTVYTYGTDRTSHTTFLNGKEILEFPNGQKETRFSDGSSEIIFPDKTRKTVLPDGTEVCTLPNGTIVHTNAEGFKVMEFVSGQKEVHTPEQKRREYPDGTVKILHSDGRTETRYKTGRVRVKDKEGNILSDTHQSVQ